MALLHPDDLRAQADRLRLQAEQLREIATDLDRAAGATLAAAEKRERVMQARNLHTQPVARITAGITRGCPADLGEHACMYTIGTHEGLHECECGEQWETEQLGAGQ